MKRLKWLLGFLFCVVFLNCAIAGPWVLPGDLSVKSDIDLLADAGLIKAPVMTWPIAWVNIGPALLSPEVKKKIAKEPISIQEAYQRVLALYQKNYQLYRTQTALYASGSNRLNPFRTFQYQPYAKFATGVSNAYQMKHFAGSFNLSYYHAPNKSYTDDVHLDNAYLYLLSENWAFGIDQFNRWWGPGYSDAMILSQNAEPFPAISLQRIQARAFKTKSLHWIGPWTVNSVVSEDGPASPLSSGIDNDLFWFTNVSFRPLESLQFDISRNVLFAGKQRPLTGAMLWYMLTLRNADASKYIPARDVPGSESWDIGVNWSLLPLFHAPFSLYLQTMFNDSGGHIPIIPDCMTFLWVAVWYPGLILAI